MSTTPAVTSSLQEAEKFMRSGAGDLERAGMLRGMGTNWKSGARE